ncbi:MAG: phosphoribosylformylglycinamidine synthase subunit PurQ, partial [Clostridiales bacterium]
TRKDDQIYINDAIIPIDEARKAWMETLEPIFHVYGPDNQEKAPHIDYEKANTYRPALTFAKPKVIIPVFPGTNCEYDTQRAFEKAGAQVETVILRNLTPQDIGDSVKFLTEKIKNCQIIAFPGGFSAGDEPDGSGKFIAAVFKNPALKEAVNEHLQLHDGLILGICNGFQALIKLGLVPYGEIRDINAQDPTLTFNTIGRHISRLVSTKVVSALSPWFNQCSLDTVYNIPISHGEGRFVAPYEMLKNLAANGQIATQYVNHQGKALMNSIDNPNGSLWAIEGITSPDGRVLGKMGHSERMSVDTALNIPGEKIQPIFSSGVQYFK